MDPNVKFTDNVLIRTESGNKLRTNFNNGTRKRYDEVLPEAVKIGRNSNISKFLELINPRVIIYNSADQRIFLNENCRSSSENIQPEAGSIYN